jgi:hypothetical protein
MHVVKRSKETQFVALIADETSDVSEHMQMVIVSRYEMNGNLHERFWGFFNPGQSAAGIPDCILTELNSIFSADSNKIIAQTFDEAAIMMSRKLSRKFILHCHFVFELQMQIKYFFPINLPSKNHGVSYGPKNT